MADGSEGHTSRLVLGVDLTATFVFGLEGGLAGVPVRLDLFGLTMVALLTATGGGMVRDVLMGDTPPRALRTVRYLALGMAGGLVAFLVHDRLGGRADDTLVVLDAIGLSLFAVVGAALALSAGMRPVTAVLLGAITAVGGGVLRDVVLDEVPLVLRANVYALAAITGAAVVVVLVQAGRSRTAAMVLGAAACFSLRMVAVWFDWNLPVAT